MPSSYLASFRDLFNVAFVSCWSELHEELQNELVKHLEMALESQIPEITQTLLNLAEFMEHTEKVLHYLLWALGWAFKAPFTRNRANSIEDCGTACRTKSCSVPRVLCERMN